MQRLILAGRIRAGDKMTKRMATCARVALALAGMGAAHAADKLNTLSIVIGGGPHAGSYQASANEVICMHAKKQDVFTSAWKGFAPARTGAMEEAGIEVSDPDSAKPKFARARVSFFGADGKLVVYETVQSPVTLLIRDRTGKIEFDAKTANGVRIRVVASCMDVEYL
jgi:hypothetical protein